VGVGSLEFSLRERLRRLRRLASFFVMGLRRERSAIRRMVCSTNWKTIRYGHETPTAARFSPRIDAWNANLSLSGPFQSM